MKRTADVVIIGAGVIGCSTAYHLTQMGVTDIAIVEMGQVGNGSSSKSASMLGLQFHEDDLCLRMAKHSYAKYMAFEEELGSPIDYHNNGWFSVVTEESVELLRSAVDLLHSQDVSADLLEPEELKQRFPELNTDDLALAMWSPDAGPVDPHMIMWGYLKRARDQGAQLFLNERATGMAITKDRVVGVETEKGFISAPLVINAAGPWASEVGAWADVPIPINNMVRTVVVTGPLDNFPKDCPIVDDLSTEWYVRPEGQGVLMGMGTEPAQELEPKVNEEMVVKIIETAINRMPVLETASVLTTWAGIRPVSADGHPMVGPAPAVDGFFLNCGWGGSGISLAPIAGQLVAELICQGHTPIIDTEPLSIKRFEHDPQLQEEVHE